MKKQDIVLMAIAAANKVGLSPVQLQKSMFLIGRSGLPEIPDDYYPFYAYHYGPFHQGVYDDAQSLAEQGLVVTVPEGSEGWSRYVATAAGTDHAADLRGASSGLADVVHETVEWVQAQTFSGLLRTIYAKYPEFRENSVFQG